MKWKVKGRGKKYATLIAAATLAPVEKPAKIPSVLANNLAASIASLSFTVITPSIYSFFFQRERGREREGGREKEEREFHG